MLAPVRRNLGPVPPVPWTVRSKWLADRSGQVARPPTGLPTAGVDGPPGPPVVDDGAWPSSKMWRPASRLKVPLEASTWTLMVGVLAGSSATKKPWNNATLLVGPTWTEAWATVSWK